MGPSAVGTSKATGAHYSRSAPVAILPAAFLMQADFNNFLLRRVNLTSGLVTTLAGRNVGAIGVNNRGRADGQGTAASFYRPTGVAMDSAGSLVVVVRSGQSPRERRLR